MKKVNQMLLTAIIAALSVNSAVAYSSDESQSNSRSNSSQLATMKESQSNDSSDTVSALTTKVTSALQSTRGLNSDHISISITRGGIVQLNGSVESATQSKLAEQAAQAVDGVQRVNNNLTVNTR